MAATLHPEIAHLASLLGTWRGEGHGDYPTIEAFRYAEEVTIGHVGKPFLAYAQKTRRIGDHPEAGMPLHAEVGYLRASGPEGIELLIAQPTGIAEIHEGTFRKGVLELRPATVMRTSTAKNVTTVERRMRVDGDELRYEVWMGAVGEPHQWHLSAVLRRT